MQELSVLHWLQYIANTQTTLEESPDFAERVLIIVSKQYPHLSANTQQDVIKLLKTKKCISTRFGMKKPGDAYFPSVNLFDDLPVIVFSHARAINDAFLSALGIRKVRLL